MDLSRKTLKKESSSGEEMPYLSAEGGGNDEEKVGFLHLSNPERKLEIGVVATKEFKLVQCLFSPQNFLSAKYQAVFQTQERAVQAMQSAKDRLAGETAKNKKALSQSYKTIQGVIKTLKTKEVGKFLTFIFEDDKVQMVIVR